MPELTVRKDIKINAPTSTVWDILTKPEYINQWDEVPEDFDEEQLSMGSDLVWEHGDADGNITKLTVTELHEESLLKEQWYSSTVVREDTSDINYIFMLSGTDTGTILSISIGDWGSLENGQDYYDASVEFAENASQKIKELAEDSH